MKILSGVLRLPASLKRLQPPDEFVERILCTVPGMTHPGNLYLFDRALRDMAGHGPILEIGSFCGQSTILLAHLLDKYHKPNPIWCVDPFYYLGWLDEQAPSADYLRVVGGQSHMEREAYLAFVRESFFRNTRFFIRARPVYLFQLTSEAFFQALRADRPLMSQSGDTVLFQQKFSFCFIDGDHRYENTRADLLNCLDFTEAGGYILMDDTERHSRLGSARLGQEAEGWPGLRIVARNPNVLFMRVALQSDPTR